jgi:hypothetical protein
MANETGETLHQGENPVDEHADEDRLHPNAGA